MKMIRKHAIWVVIATLVGLMGAWLVVSGKQVEYTSTSDVDVEARIISGAVPVTPNMATEEKVATSGDVLGTAAPELGLSPGHLSTHVKVSVSGTSNILTIGCTMPNPVSAQQCDMVVTQAYINFRNQGAAKKSTQEHDPLNVTLVTSAVLPISPSGTKKSVLLSIGAFLGFLLGLGAAYVRDRADDRVRDRGDLSRHLGAPALVVIPRIRRRIEPAFAFFRAPASAAAEAYRYLRVRIDELMPASAARGYVVLATGPRGGEGSTSVANNLAISLALSGARVILVDGDVQNPSLTKLYGAVDRPGLTDLLAGMLPLAAVMAATEVPRLSLVPAGTALTGSADVFDSGTLARPLAQMTVAGDVVVVDSAPVLAVSAPLALASVSQIVVVAASTRHTTHADIRAAGQELTSSGERHVVGVLTDAPRGRLLRSLFPARHQESIALAHGGSQPNVNGHVPSRSENDNPLTQPGKNDERDAGNGTQASLTAGPSGTADGHH
jgi:Mrp family chromosome partitioning ATPase/capsular polysaccharide biosynthesis protein